MADAFCQTFEISVEIFGEVRQIEKLCNLFEFYEQMQSVGLLEDGRGADVEVTNENRAEYVARYVEYVLDKGVERQFSAFSRGFHMVCGGPTLQLFRPVRWPFSYENFDDFLLLLKVLSSQSSASFSFVCLFFCLFFVLLYYYLLFCPL